jgi:hypothetical protein
LTTAATAAAGGAAERLEVVALPEPVSWESIDRWVRSFSHDGQSGRIERCLFTAHQIGAQDQILPLLFACAVESNFIGFNDNIISLGYLTEITDVFGWEESAELVFNLGSKLVGRGRGKPDLFRRDAIHKMNSMTAVIDGLSPDEAAVYREDALVDGLLSIDIEKSFDAVGKVLKDGPDLDQIITTLVLLAADRMARTPVNVDGGWGCLTTELNLAAALGRRPGGRQRPVPRGLAAVFRPLAQHPLTPA